jgi:hypothetical protein
MLAVAFKQYTLDACLEQYLLKINGGRLQLVTVHRLFPTLLVKANIRVYCLQMCQSMLEDCLSYYLIFSSTRCHLCNELQWRLFCFSYTIYTMMQYLAVAKRFIHCRGAGVGGGDEGGGGALNACAQGERVWKVGGLGGECL